MTLVERTAGSPLGLYTACLASTLYLMLPMFNGAGRHFPGVLVPIAGQREALLLKDAKMLAKTMVKQLPASRHGEAGEGDAGQAFLVEAKMQKDGVGLRIGTPAPARRRSGCGGRGRVAGECP